jgi:bacillithiol system protein YtxJ
MAEPALVTTTAELEYLFRESAERPVLVFKHSLTCPLSTTAFHEYLEFLKDRDAAGALYTLIEVQRARQLSNEVASRTGVRHESPQAIVLRGGRAVWNASHWDISAEALEAGLASAEDDAG